MRHNHCQRKPRLPTATDLQAPQSARDPVRISRADRFTTDTTVTCRTSNDIGRSKSGSRLTSLSGMSTHRYGQRGHSLITIAAMSAVRLSMGCRLHAPQSNQCSHASSIMCRKFSETNRGPTLYRLRRLGISLFFREILLVLPPPNMSIHNILSPHGPAPHSSLALFRLGHAKLSTLSA